MENKAVITLFLLALIALCSNLSSYAGSNNYYNPYNRVNVAPSSKPIHYDRLQNQDGNAEEDSSGAEEKGKTEKKSKGGKNKKSKDDGYDTK